MPPSGADWRDCPALCTTTALDAPTSSRLTPSVPTNPRHSPYVLLAVGLRSDSAKGTALHPPDLIVINNNHRTDSSQASHIRDQERRTQGREVGGSGGLGRNPGSADLGLTRFYQGNRVGGSSPFMDRGSPTPTFSTELNPASLNCTPRVPVLL